ncbi:2-oxo acid dehydrogenase subunit E2 [Defluviimonas sp. WL0024]|uniref:Dihydrolipoamide acetyltransferase component of pyruvate dehydrogenase complex n=1 Tax=Albidovulum salinarum TaxID=2984153 RepID=A0ABT2X7R9_9RHOB|nr:dihydrolipoamide acetyltransferase family protein [Defluviimonas sp. WL0024]MCU9850003.1 2-oxo acid dehydrogenase subunit E2 [Defluviimonas sp. WL0024]
MGEFRMPSLGADMEAGTLVEWLKAPGDRVARGDIVAVVETQKGAIEIEVFEDGLLERTLVGTGTKVPVGTPLAVIRAPGEAAAPTPTPEPVATQEPEPEAPAPEPMPRPEPAAPPPASGERLRITPLARRLAEKKGLDEARLRAIAGTGPEGAITLRDLEAPGEAPAEPAAPMTEMRAAIAAAMARSKREIPHYYLAQQVDLTPASAFLAAANADRAPEDRILMGALFLHAVTRAARDYPEFNGHFTDGAFHPSAEIHAAMAVALRGGGLVAPAILDAGACDLASLMARMRDTLGRARTGRFRARELSEATITVTSLGERGVDTLYGVIQPPQVAIVGFGTPAERPVVRDGTIAAAMTTTVTLAADHRVSDGHRGALFLRAIDRNLQEPEAP